MALGAVFADLVIIAFLPILLKVSEYQIGPDYAAHSAENYFNMRKTSIYGGSNEIQRNIITKMILGL